MPCFIKLYIPTIACNAIPALISNVILTSPSATWRQLKVTYRAYKALFRPGEVWQGISSHIQEVKISYLRL